LSFASSVRLEQTLAITAGLEKYNGSSRGFSHVKLTNPERVI
jgi:hypothetical protein